jgi:hypothetical protein
LDTVGEGFTMICTNGEVVKLMEDSTMTADRVIEILLVDMS